MRLPSILSSTSPFNDHHELVDVVHVVGPDLAGRIDPEPARTRARVMPPIRGCGRPEPQGDGASTRPRRGRWRAWAWRLAVR